MHPARRKKWNRGSIAIVAIFAIAWAVFLVSSPGCGSNDARIEQHGDGTAEVKQQQGAVVIDKLLADMDTTFKAIESIKAEMRAGTQEKTDNSITEGDKIQAEAQQQGFFVFSWQEMAGGGAGVVGAIVLIVIILNVVKSKRIESEVSERADTQESSRHARTLESNDKVITRIVRMHGVVMNRMVIEFSKAIAARGAN